ncbi:hypothetical protein SPM17_22950 [Enterobacter hormaechei subsp. xiangfangensis]|uniref:hypothetical protein n=1 Tax=Enterobacter cloacae complex TaxID=354276 RepID=UPI00094FA938|nr:MULTISPECIES: hypothetical protein [Enterobacter cloacae complex]ASQ79575.1 hypothetical protein B1023_24750 [Enterobacter hormaechei]EKK5923340.1 hypothetical protein [Enterobacter hormaechei]ELC7456546.1 hypothetical protein [Enterobacter hormaechei]ELJ6239936.1 hypothetical protein [Enterobacter hormaechei]ELZ5043431.1 hypothetical protein [Enterobacter hormaechei]
MKHTAQDVLRAAEAGNFPYPFTLEDAQKVLDASPEPVTIDSCIFIWIDEGDGLLRIYCTGKPEYTLNHPASLPSLAGRIRKFKNELTVTEKKKKPKTPGPR